MAQSSANTSENLKAELCVGSYAPSEMVDHLALAVQAGLLTIEEAMATLKHKGFVPPEAAAQVAAEAAEIDTRPQIIRWSLHTLKQMPVLKLQVEGQKYYGVGQVVSNRDFANDGTTEICKTLGSVPQSFAAEKFRGVVATVHVDLGSAGKVFQNLTIDIEQHAWIDSGKYKLRGIASSEQYIPASSSAHSSTTSLGTASIPSAQPKLPLNPPESLPAVPTKKPRKFYVD